MPFAVDHIDGSQFGSVEARKLAPGEIGDILRARSMLDVTRYTWRPLDKMIANIPLLLGLDSVEVNGIRRFTIPDIPSAGNYPSEPRYANDTTDFLLLASVGGAKILETHKIAPKSEVLDYDTARIFLQYVWNMREWLGESRQFSKLLHIDAKGRSDPTTRTILPENLGLDNSGNGTVWSLDQLMASGERAVQLAGISDPTVEDVFRYGLLEAARVAPLYLSNDDVRWITRSALFALPEEKCLLTNEQLKYVADRATEALSNHLDDSNEEFRSWLEDDKSDLPKFISRPSESLVTRQEARLGLLEICWESFNVVGQCVDAQMRAFRDGLSEPLSDDDRVSFDSIFLTNPSLTSIPFVMLHKRLSFLPETLINCLWTDPSDRETVAIMHRMLYFYAEMAGNRRSADRLRKRRLK